LGLYLGKLIPVTGDNTAYTQSINIGPKFKQGEGTLPLAYIDAEHSGTWTRFCNHSCTNNAKFDEATVGDTRVLALRATKDIKVNEEITVDYQNEHFEHRKCLCRPGVGKCRYPNQDNPIKRLAPAPASTPVPATPRRAKRIREDDDDEYTLDSKRRTP
jgi:SET domain-containing protein